MQDLKAFVDCATENFSQLCFSQPVVAESPSRNHGNSKQKNQRNRKYFDLTRTQK